MIKGQKIPKINASFGKNTTEQNKKINPNIKKIIKK